jgi:hypothetical protein
MPLAEIRRNCFVTIKAVQNFRAAKLAIARLLESVESQDDLALQSIFHYAVIKYAKPFTPTRTDTSKVRYDVDHLRTQEGFDPNLHDDLIALRNELIAHDDITTIQPRILSYGISLRGDETHIPTALVIANLSLGYPVSQDSVVHMHAHIHAAERGGMKDLHVRLREFRDYVIQHPLEKAELLQYIRHVATLETGENGARVPPQDLASEEYLNIVEPQFAQIEDGFRYEKFSVRCNFHGPERIQLANGWSVRITPPNDE